MMQTLAKGFFLVCTFILFILSSASEVSARAADNFTWTGQNTGLSARYIVGVAVDHTTPTTVYALTTASGVYKSTDSGSNWSAVNTGLPSSLSTSMSHLFGNLLTMDPNDSSTLYINIDGKVQKTSNGGTSWSESNTGINVCNPNQVAGVVVDPTNSSHLFAAHVASGCSGGLFESTDSGANWTQIAGEGMGSGIVNDVWTLAIDPTNNQKLYLNTVHIGFAYSTNGGVNWTINNPTGASEHGYTVGVNPGTPSRIMIGNSIGLYVSTDSGLTFTDKTSQVSGGISDIKFAPSNSLIGYLVGSNGLYTTTDGGLNWSAVGSYSTNNLNSIDIHPTDPNTLYIGSRGNGMYTSTNGGSSLTAINTGLPGSPQVGVTITSDYYLASVTGQGIYKSTDEGYTWRKVLNGTFAGVSVAPSNSNIVYARTFVPLAVSRSADAGETWTTIYTDSYIGALTIDPNDPNRVIGLKTNTTLIKTIDGGQNWSTITVNQFSSSLATNGLFYDLANSSRVYAHGLGDFYVSTDAGETFTASSTGLECADCDWIDSTAYDSRSPTTIFVTTRAAKIFKSTDSGATWVLVNTNALEFHSLTFSPFDYNTMYAIILSGSPYNWYKTTDGGANWTAQDLTGISNESLSSVRQDPTDSTRFIGSTYNAGVMIYENYIPIFSTSSFEAKRASDNLNFTVGDTIELVFTARNSGPATGTDPYVVITLPSNVTYIENSTKVDGATVSPDPETSKVVTVTLSSLLRTGSVAITLQVRLDNSSNGQIVIDPYIYSDEDTSGTQIPNITISLNPFASINPCIPIVGWVYCIMAGPHFTGYPAFISDGEDPLKALTFIARFAHHDDLYITIRKWTQNEFVTKLKTLKVPSQNGFVQVGEIYEYRAYAAYNGFRVNKFDNYVTVVLGYDKNKLGRVNEKNLRLAWYDEGAKRWKLLPNKNVINTGGKTVANVTKQYSYFVVVYVPSSKTASPMATPTPTVQGVRTSLPKPSPTIKPKKTSEKTCFWFICF